jgi:hypothetical protein
MSANSHGDPALSINIARSTALPRCISQLAHRSHLGYISSAEVHSTSHRRTAAALLKRLFEANWAMRSLSVVDCNTPAIQTEDAFTQHLPHLSASRS